MYMSLDVVRGDSPLFRRIANSLAESIGRGDFAIGGQLPTEFALMRMFGASRFTIREALVELRARGLVASRRGLGTVVLRAAPQEAAFREVYESIDEFLAGIVQAPVTTREVADIVADAELASQLRCEEGRKFIMLRGERRRLGHSEEPPIALVWAYVNATYELLRPKLTNLTESIASHRREVSPGSRPTNCAGAAAHRFGYRRRDEPRCSGRFSRHVGTAVVLPRQ